MIDFSAKLSGSKTLTAECELTPAVLRHRTGESANSYLRLAQHYSELAADLRKIIGGQGRRVTGA